MALLLLLLVVASGQGLAQNTPADLRQRRQQLLRELERNRERLTRTRRDQEATLEQLALLGAQIRRREELVGTLQSEIEQTEASINRTSEVIDALSVDVERLKVEYARTLNQAYRAFLTRSWVTFLFSSSSFNEAFRRWQYLRQYQRYRQRQARFIEDTQDALRAKLTHLETRRTEKAELLGAATRQRQLLAKERTDQDQMLRKLKSSESQLVAQIAAQQRAHEALNLAIENAIAEEMTRQRRAVAAAPEATPGSRRPAAAEATASQGFAGQRGQLPWPVGQGSVSRKYGKQSHPTLPNIQIVNHGIDIATTQGAEVKAVYAGEVVSLPFVPGYRHTVLVKHGEFYTVYSNLASVAVSKGQQLAAGERIGVGGGAGEDVHFEIWRQQQRLNPEEWIGRR